MDIEAKDKERIYLNDPLKKYLEEINRYTLLTEEEEKIIGERILMGDKEAIDILIKHNLRLVIHVAKKIKLRNKNLSFWELIEEGNLGLIIATHKYDVTKNCKFSSFAIPIIEQTIIKGINNNENSIKVATSTRSKIYEYKKTKESLFDKLKRKPTVEELIEITGLNEKEILKYEFLGKDVLSLNSCFDDSQRELLELLESSEEKIEDKVEKNIIYKDLIKNLSLILNKLEYDIINLRYGLQDDKPKTLQEISEIKKISRECVRTNENKALDKIRNYLYKRNFLKEKNKQFSIIDNIEGCSEIIKRISKYLTEIELSIFLLRNGLLDNKFRSVEFVSDLFNISPYRVKRIEKDAINKIIFTNEFKELVLNNKKLMKRFGYLLNEKNTLEEEKLYDNIYEFIIEKVPNLNKGELKKILNFLINTKLTELEIKVLILKYYLNLDNVSSYFDLHTNEINVIEKDALKKIKNQKF